MAVSTAEESSFRDPAGQVIIENGTVLRQLNSVYMAEYRYLMSSGLYGELAGKGLLIPHTEMKAQGNVTTIIPERVKFISYPYEWCFSMLKEAALSTLEINRIALSHNMLLKDASAYNMQWHNGKMTLIDTLSFMRYDGSEPWVAYRQFIEHFLAPLLLMKHRDASLVKLLEVHLDGIPINLAVKLLPGWLRLKPSLMMHLYAQNLAPSGKRVWHDVKMPRRNLEALLDSLEGLVRGLGYKPKSAWSEYDQCSYTHKAEESKMRLVSAMVHLLPYVQRGTLCDLGANIGIYSSLAKIEGYKMVVAIDKDHDCVEYGYSYTARKLNILPLVFDITNPSPAIGWEGKERKSLLDRLQVDTIMALALIHHLCIGNNTPVGRVASMLAGHCKNLIIEFVPPEDPKAQLLAGSRVFPPYTRELFELEFGKHFDIVNRADIEDSFRSIYLMRRNGR
jgi:hypothetical protein